mmetsp:Transcript_8089/g.19860  ORF Transcript_8089/g.19860 Transcript_8089/m.19860 type:complete len:244 (-) Transcript_8089:60-791(-)
MLSILKPGIFLGAASPSSSHPRSFGSLGNCKHSFSSRMQDMNPVTLSSPNAAKHPVEHVGSPPHRARQERLLRQSLLSAHSLNFKPHSLSSAKHSPRIETQGPELQGRHGGRSAKPPPVSSAVARSVADQCSLAHVGAELEGKTEGLPSDTETAAPFQLKVMLSVEGARGACGRSAWTGAAGERIRQRPAARPASFEPTDNGDASEGEALMTIGCFLDAQRALDRMGSPAPPAGAKPGRRDTH